MKVQHTVTKIGISLPTDLLREVERTRKETGLPRSALIRRALEDYFARRERDALVQRYVESYRACPEAPAEVKAARKAAARLLAREPWE